MPLKSTRNITNDDMRKKLCVSTHTGGRRRSRVLFTVRIVSHRKHREHRGSCKYHANTLSVKLGHDFVIEAQILTVGLVFSAVQASVP